MAAKPEELNASIYDEPPLEGLDSETHSKLLAWVSTSFTAAESARKPLDMRWERYYKAYRSYIKRRKGDWRSRIYLPVVFYVVETILPKIVAQLPAATVAPVGQDDVESAKQMEHMLQWASDRTDLYLELVKAFKSSLKYGTGVIKVRLDEQTGTRRVSQPMMQPQTQMTNEPLDDGTGSPMMDMNDEPMTQPNAQPLPPVPLMDAQGNPVMESTVEQFTKYSGPVAEAIDIFNFWPAPEATSMDDARYVMHRVFKDMAYVKRQVEEGIYVFPEGYSYEQFATAEDLPHLERMKRVGIDAGSDPTFRVVEIIECWTASGKLYTMLNRKCIVRAQENPYDHGQLPFVRITDHFQEFEFWGVGEIEPLEGLQDQMNALTNMRIDNVKLALNLMFLVDPAKVPDMGDLKVRPGGIVRVNSDGNPLNTHVSPLEMGDVTGSSYQEVQEAEGMVEKVSAVSPYTAGADSPGQPDTATGVALISEQGNTRFGLKVRLAEMVGLKRLFNQFASILAQFGQDMPLRVLGPDGQWTFQQITADSLQGAYDIDIEAQSQTITESIRREQSQSLLGMFAQIVDPQTGLPLVNLNQMAKDVLESFDIKDLQNYLPQAPAPQPAPGMVPPGMDPSMMGQIPPGQGPPQQLPPEQMPPGQMPPQQMPPDQQMPMPAMNGQPA